MSSSIVESIWNVYSELGSFHKENVYQTALYIDLNEKAMTVQTEIMVPIVYKNYTIGFCRADIIIYENNKPNCILELKSQTTKIGNKEISQLRKYLKYTNCEYGYVVNFYNELEILKVSIDCYEKISCDMFHQQNQP